MSRHAPDGGIDDGERGHERDRRHLAPLRRGGGVTGGDHPAHPAGARRGDGGRGSAPPHPSAAHGRLLGARLRRHRRPAGLPRQDARDALGGSRVRLHLPRGLPRPRPHVPPPRDPGDGRAARDHGVPGTPRSRRPGRCRRLRARGRSRGGRRRHVRRHARTGPPTRRRVGQPPADRAPRSRTGDLAAHPAVLAPHRRRGARPLRARPGRRRPAPGATHPRGGRRRPRRQRGVRAADGQPLHAPRHRTTARRTGGCSCATSGTSRSTSGPTGRTATTPRRWPMPTDR